ncbi:MAG: OmpA family protein [candidate division FCPU426 bacterium]
MRELITLVVCLVLFLLAMQSGMIRSGLEYQTIKQENQNLQSANEQLTQEIKRLKSLAANPDATVSTATVSALQRLDQIREQMERRLSREVRSREIAVEQGDEDMRLVILDKQLFSGQSDRLLPSGRSLLLKIARVLNPYSDMEIRVTDHTSLQELTAAAKKQYPSLLYLSTARASTVAQLLAAEGGLDPVQIMTAGFGPSRPVVPNDTDYHRTLNGRVEISLYQADEEKLKQAKDIVRTEPALPAKPAGSEAESAKEESGAKPIGREALDQVDDNAFDAGYELPKDMR